MDRMSGNEINTGYVNGAAWWVFADFKSPRRMHSQISKYNLKGVVDQLRQPKLAYFEITTLFRNTPTQSKVFRSALSYKYDTTFELSRKHSFFKIFQNQYSRTQILKKHSIFINVNLKSTYNFFFEFLKTTLKSIAFKNIRYV